ncbi:MAG: class I SAM-dependent methyltransferase [Candidatus Delongbacteria bacterium]|nr:class I SAM-dependent methyltransferase [Candidatus Delongbacteria bacterium]
MEAGFDQIKQYWENQSTLSLKDTYLKRIEVQKIVSLIASENSRYERALEIGCGDGEGTHEYSSRCRHLVALDYSFTMLQKARQQTADQDSISLVQADVRHLPFKPSIRFDLIISERCLINLPQKSEQEECIRQLTHRLNPAGRFVLVEGSKQGLERLNRIRHRVGLPPIPMPWHNQFFDESDLIPFLKPFYSILHQGSFWYYYIGSRVIQPALIYPDEPKHDSELNRITWQVYQDLGEDFWPHLQEPFTIGQIFYLDLQKTALQP